MFDFVTKYNFLVQLLPDFLHNKWIITLMHLVFFWIVIKLTNAFVERFLDKICRYKDDFEFRKQLATLKSIIKSILDTIIIIFATMFILNNLGIDIRPIMTAAGVLGVAVGFGARRFFEDIITGLSLILEGQVRVGDYVKISEHEGVVEKADIKLVQLRDLQGRVHYIRNGMIDIVTNYTRDYSYYVFDVSVAYKEDISRVIAVLEELGKDFMENSVVKDEIVAPLEMLGLDKFDDSAVIVKARFRTKPMKQWLVGRAFNQEIKRKFDELGIEIPFPQCSVHIEKD